MAIAASQEVRICMSAHVLRSPDLDVAALYFLVTNAMADAAAGAASRKQEVIDLVMRRLQPLIANAISGAP